MSSRAWHTVSRRAALTGFAITAAYGCVVAEQASDGTWGGDGAGPIFSPSGPNAELYEGHRDSRLPITRFELDPENETVG